MEDVAEVASKASSAMAYEMFESSTENNKSKLRDVRRKRRSITKSDLAKFGYTKGCRRCIHTKVYGGCKGGIHVYHTEVCRDRIIEAMRSTEAGLERPAKVRRFWQNRIEQNSDLAKQELLPAAQDGRRGRSNWVCASYSAKFQAKIMQIYECPNGSVNGGVVGIPVAHTFGPTIRDLLSTGPTIKDLLPPQEIDEGRRL